MHTTLDTRYTNIIQATHNLMIFVSTTSIFYHQRRHLLYCNPQKSLGSRKSSTGHTLLFFSCTTAINGKNRKFSIRPIIAKLKFQNTSVPSITSTFGTIVRIIMQGTFTVFSANVDDTLHHRTLSAFITSQYLFTPVEFFRLQI